MLGESTAMTDADTAREPFEDSRRLTGCNFYFADTGAALEVAPGVAFDESSLRRWQTNIALAREALGWADGEAIIRRHRTGASLAFAAPPDQLYAATEVNEWAWWSAVEEGFCGSDGSRDSASIDPCSLESVATSVASTLHFHAPGHAAAWDADSALHTLHALAAAEAKPALLALRDAATARALPFLPDDDELSIGTGEGGQTWPIDALPAPSDIDWQALHTIPTALVTGSNGKTTTVRLVAAMARAHGWRTTHSCTDGVFFDGEALESGDFSGPTGARTALRQPQVQAAVLETARGGMLRRGLALCRADAAVVTNISADHFGEYGVHDLDDLAAVKLTVARAIDASGILVLNADDDVLVRQSEALDRQHACPRAWFALDFDAPLLVAQRDVDAATCGVRGDRLLLSWRGETHDLGAIDAMPLTLGGRATYNIANIAAATLVARGMGVTADIIAATLARFGSARGDNAGRLQHWRFGKLDVYVDYAHNPDGLRGLLQAIDAGQRDGRLAITLGHAGNREDDDLRAVAATAAAFAPDYVLLKDVGGYERGRDSGEIAAIMRAELLDRGVPAQVVQVHLDEFEASCKILAWARDGDLVAMPVLAMPARSALGALLDRMQAMDWRPGDDLPGERSGDS